MDKRKKMILIVTTIIVILIAISAIVVYFIMKSNNANEVSKLNTYYEKLKNSNEYNFSVILDEKNNTYYTKQNTRAYINSTYKGKNSKYIIKDGNTYLLKDSDKTYYTYTNNEIELYKIELQINNIKDKDATSGKEKVEGKKYAYEEFAGLTDFYFDSIKEGVNEDNIKTRFYFDNNNNLVYIKTIIDENTQQLVKVDFSENVDNNLFEIPSDYEKM